MNTELELELGRAAKRRGITKSQFIIDAVERALGRKDPYRALVESHRAFALPTVGQPQPPMEPGSAAGSAAESIPSFSREALREKLLARHEAELRDWLAYQDARRRGETWSADDGPEADRK